METMDLHEIIDNDLQENDDHHQISLSSTIERAGHKQKKIVEEIEGHIPRRRLITRVGCQAQIVLKYCNDGKYIVFRLKEKHTHPLYSPRCMKFQKQGRNLTILHKKMIVDNSKMNVGPVRTYRQIKENVGGYNNVGASKQDFKNFHRDLKAYIYESDAQMFIDIFNKKKLLWSTFFFDFDMDKDDHLCRALWADPICRKNYALFGDMVSFDTTYQTNRYNMIFGPFTGVDHHKKCVTFAACFIAKEDIASFEWVFKTFLNAIGSNEPTCLITDQDPAMKIAIKNVFKKTEHRFCMWHIMKKMNDKLGRTIMQETNFLKRIQPIVWSVEIEPVEFDEKWKAILSEFNLEKHEWLCQIFEIRKMWIPAYFRDLFLGGIMRTTSRSESENNFFTAFTNSHLSLVEFYMRFDSAMDAQRHNQAHNDNEAKHKRPVCKTPMGIETHGVDVYTTTVFYEFQEEVTYSNIEDETKCSCKKFERQGLPCRHMVWVWKAKMLESILQKAQGSEENIKDLVKKFQAIRMDLEAKNTQKDTKKNKTRSKNQDINKGTGVHIPKGNSDKRLKGEREKAVEENQKKRGYAESVNLLLTMIAETVQKKRTDLIY
ncbi:protein FAR1-RELATED SEQUENCE 5-like [Euphorbia lathyris]|uniref:protein FAR1-RELATED SEQUENCE 5-like n=1 Tax=Euphorbia lathyris TaxID=212925 RepID=UPI003313B30C